VALELMFDLLQVLATPFVEVPSVDQLVEASSPFEQEVMNLREWDWNP
jgi:hypothetical protein